MKKIIVLLVVILLLTGCNKDAKIVKKIELSNSGCIVDIEEDTHKGFHNDGDYYARIKCTDIDYDKLSSNWKKLPLTNELNKVMSMEQCDDEDCKDVYLKYNIPKFTSGYYYFKDRHSESKNKYDDSEINNRASYNFTLALLNKENGRVYVYELDT